MKESLTSLSGQLIGTNLSMGNTQARTFSYTIPAENNGEWKAENIEFTVFVTAESQDGEVLQAAQIHL